MYGSGTELGVTIEAYGDLFPSKIFVLPGHLILRLHPLLSNYGVYRRIALTIISLYYQYEPASLEEFIFILATMDLLSLLRS